MTMHKRSHDLVAQPGAAGEPDAVAQHPGGDPSLGSGPLRGTNGDANFVLVNGQAYHLPNNIADLADAGTEPPRRTPRRPARRRPLGRRPSSVPNIPPAFSPSTFYNNPVRAGLSKSIINPGTGYYVYFDADDDNSDTTDLWPFFNLNSNPIITPESGNYYDLTGSLSLPVERLRRFVSPIDATGDGIVAQYNSGNTNTGNDLFGRVFFFKHFRPAGLPTIVSYNAATEVGPWTYDAPARLATT